MESILPLAAADSTAALQNYDSHFVLQDIHCLWHYFLQLESAGGMGDGRVRHPFYILLVPICLGGAQGMCPA